MTRRVSLDDMSLSSIAVFCGSSPGADPAYERLGYEVGSFLAGREIQVVYGAGGKGVMGALAQGALDAGGQVVGVIPRSMVEWEWGRDDLTECEIVEGMHERKASMARRAQAFLALPGGLGTLEEIVEVWTWQRLGYHHKPVAFLDADGFWRPFLSAMKHIEGQGFLAPAVLDEVIVEDSVPGVVEALAAACSSHR
ncbi:hypothetical protein SAMN05421595_2111 [Austwickia chelonae]|uniref:Cytokinin riboside 5'-monophosphate phosphoribohydrolase n=1 Tax=Austwickia chelonae NBRC 105200 TaxID=1184607 RepID=K6UL68_9MICO|nr:TIGR00730 family Rossman fold protein [Austwickia chelonae]GAB76976.1 hypothetical protein AUCHE_04_00160 [Austwickia chelonae NBRC 105200]SEW32915.1 hypothetical protein SAMN05421595_2111 [Austwickia chelonae]